LTPLTLPVNVMALLPKTVLNPAVVHEVTPAEVLLSQDIEVPLTSIRSSELASKDGTLHTANITAIVITNAALVILRSSQLGRLTNKADKSCRLRGSSQASEEQTPRIWHEIFHKNRGRSQSRNVG